MNGPSGFQEVRSSAPRSSTNRLLDEQRPQFGKVSGAVSVLLMLLAFAGHIAFHTEQAHGVTSITHTTGAGDLGTQVLLPIGHVYGITGGTPVGTNLYHSFAQFNVGTGDIAQFQTLTLTQDMAMLNILGRITDANPSTIFGTIDSAHYYPNANLFLMNPYGFLFGPGAMVNVGGMVAFTTADYLRLTNDVRFEAIPGAQDVLLSALPVAAFGFLGANPAAIAVQGSHLTVADGTGLSLVGGNQGFTAIDPDNGNPISVPGGVTMTGGTLSAPGGQINLASVASPGEVSAGDFMPTSGMTMGNVSLSQAALLDVSADVAGTVRIRGGQFVIADATISADTVNANGAPIAIDINVTGDLLISDTRGVPAMTARTTGDGNAGAIQINSANLVATSSSTASTPIALIDTHTSGTGAAGNINITTGNLQASYQGSSIVQFIDSGTAGPKHGGDVRISSQSVTLEGTGINAGPALSLIEGLDPSGSSGNVTINADRLILLNSTIDTSVLVEGLIPGRAGSISLNANDINLTQSVVTSLGFGGSGAILVNAGRLIMDGGAQLDSRTVSEPGGGIIVNARVVELLNGSTLATSTFGDGRAGDIHVTVTDHLTLSTSPFNSNPSGFFSNSTGEGGGFGPGGSVVVTTPRLDMTGGSQINTVTLTSGSGGNVTINSNSISISGEFSSAPEPIFGIGTIHPGGIFTKTLGNEGCVGVCGDAGRVSITTGSLAMGSGAQIDSGTSGTRPGGDISIHATNSISMSGTLSDGSPGGIFSRSVGTSPDAGSGGNITLTAGQSVTISDGAAVSASSTGAGDAGNITIQGLITPAQSVLIDGPGSGLFTDTQGTGAGGSIFVNANTVTLQNGGTLSAATSGTVPEAIGGTITVAATDVQLNNGASISAQTTGAGNAGAITIAAEESISLLSGSFITSSSFFGGNGGPVTITAPTVSLQDSSIITLAQGFGSDLSTAGAGAVTITASKSLSLVNFSIDSSSTDTAGNAGRISLTSPVVSLSTLSTISSETSNSSFNPDGSPVGLSTDGNGGIVEIAVGQLSMTTGSSIVTQTSGGGQGGSVNVHGLAGPDRKAADITITSGSVMSTNATDIGSAGNITVDTTRLMLSGGGSMQAATIGPGAGGTITIRATEQVTISGEALVCPTCAVGQRTVPSQLIASSAADGRAGDILVETPSLTLNDGGRIFASTSGAGQGGTVTVLGSQGAGSRATSFMVSGQSSEGAASEISTDTHGSGAGGNILVNANSVTLQNGGTLSAATSGIDKTATGGTITVDATNTVTMNGASITASSAGTADAGSIKITGLNGFTMQNSTVTTQAGQGAGGGDITVTTSPDATVLLQNSKISASVADGSGGGGNISIDPQFVILQNSQILAQAAQGQGGAITIFANLFLSDANSIVNADSGSGVNGTVTIQSPNAPISGQIQPLGKTPLIATSLFNQRCASLAGGEFSSFTVAGRDSLPTEPGGWLASPLYAGGMGPGVKAEGVQAEGQWLGTGEGLGSMSASAGQGARGESLFSSSGLFRASNQRNETNQINQMDQIVLSLRQIAPAGFLTQAFAVEEPTGCQS